MRRGRRRVPGQAGWRASTTAARPPACAAADLGPSARATACGRALVLEQGNTKLAIVTLDLVGFFNNETLAIRDTLADQGLEVDYVLLHSLHNHEGPDSMGLWGEQQLVSGYDPAYRAQVRQAIVDAIGEADGAKVEVAQLVVGEVDASTYHSNGVGNVINDSRDPFVVDEMIGALRLVDDQDNTIASVVSFGNHPEALSDENTLMTSDFAHGLRRTLEQGSTWLNSPGKPGVGGTCLYINAAVGRPDDAARHGGEDPRRRDLPVGHLREGRRDRSAARRDGPRRARQRRRRRRAAARPAGTAVQAARRQQQLPGHVPARDLRSRDVHGDGRHVHRDRDRADQPRPGAVPQRARRAVPRAGDRRLRRQPPQRADQTARRPQQHQPARPAGCPEGPYLKDKMYGTYRFIVGMGNDELGYIVPEYDLELGDPPWVSEAEGDHYEETNSLGVETFARIDAAADILIAWSKWVHGAP